MSAFALESEAREVACAVVGGGPAGLVAALALARRGVEVALIGPRAGTLPEDGRTAALFASSLALLRNLGAWRALEAQCAPLAAIRIVDDTGGLLRAPEVTFEAAEVGLGQFGWNVPNAALTRGLWELVQRNPGIRVMEGRVATVEIGEAGARLGLDPGTQVAARLVAAADGRNSLCREAAGIAVRAWRYEQAAITTTFGHSRPHHGISTEFHRPAGPCTVVPLPGNSSSLVWVERPGEAQRLLDLDDGGFRQALERRLGGLLGSVTVVSARQCYPLSGLMAARMGSNRIALIGEAGHVIPPIGAQGLNLGLRDAAWIADCVAEAASQGRDPGSAAALSCYENARAGDVRSRSVAVDTLNRSLLSGLLPVTLARGLGLHVLASVPALRRAVIRQGLAADVALPSLMRAA